jgi:ElaB/YqjD/DUF883 family membrane-anchored ribosome-binding protein
MEAAEDLAEHNVVQPSTDEMRQEIDSTRSALADKVEALEDRVKGSVQTVEDSIQIAQETVDTVRRTFDIKHHVEQHPWLMVGGCFVAGLAIGYVMGLARDSIKRSVPHLAAEIDSETNGVATKLDATPQQAGTA